MAALKVFPVLSAVTSSLHACTTLHYPQVFKGGLSLTGMEEGEQFRYFSEQVGAACMDAPCIVVQAPATTPAALCHLAHCPPGLLVGTSLLM